MVKDAVLRSAKEKGGPAHFGSAILLKKGVARSVRSLLFCTSVRGQLIQMEKQRCEMQRKCMILHELMGSFKDGL